MHSVFYSVKSGTIADGALIPAEVKMKKLVFGSLFVVLCSGSAANAVFMETSGAPTQISLGNAYSPIASPYDQLVIGGNTVTLPTTGGSVIFNQMEFIVGYNAYVPQSGYQYSFNETVQFNSNPASATTPNIPFTIDISYSDTITFVGGNSFSYDGYKVTLDPYSGTFPNGNNFFNLTATVTAPEPIAGIAGGVPEPSTWAMMILGFLGVGFMAYRRTPPAAAVLRLT